MIMSKFTIEDLTELLRDASNDGNTLRHIAEEFGLSSNHPHFIMENIRKLKAKAAAYEKAQDDLTELRNRLRDIRIALNIGPEIDTLAHIKSLPKMEPKKSMTELHAVIDNLMKENLNLKIENAQLAVKIKYQE